jgi:hypothetical protein
VNGNTYISFVRASLESMENSNIVLLIWFKYFVILTENNQLFHHY